MQLWQMVIIHWNMGKPTLYIKKDLFLGEEMIETFSLLKLLKGLKREKYSKAGTTLAQFTCHAHFSFLRVADFKI